MHASLKVYVKTSNESTHFKFLNPLKPIFQTHVLKHRDMVVERRIQYQGFDYINV